MKYQAVIIGGGILGLSTAYNLLKKKPGLKLVLLEKEEDIGTHQTGNNSGVIHSGLYYKPGSMKARNCLQGYRQLLEFCRRQDIAFEICGKIVVATRHYQLPLLDNLHQRGKENGLKGLVKVPQEALVDYEPHVAGLEGLWVPQTGIIDFMDVARKLAELIQDQGGVIKTSSEVTGIRKGQVITADKTYNGRCVISCAGLYSDKVARMTEPQLDLRIIPFRGEYYQLRPERQFLVRNLIYPVPDPKFPFLGVHFTRMIKGGVEAGPNAVLALAKEGYQKSTVHWGELLDTLRWPGFQKIAFKYWFTGLGEMYRSFSKLAFTKALQELIPEVQEDDLIPGGAGVRAQASSRQGGLIDDFVIIENPSGVHVCNAPSPAATSSLAIGDYISDKVLTRL